MERLHADVTAAVGATTRQPEDAALTFERVRALADAAVGAAPRTPLGLASDRRRPPRLTEPWFC